MRSAFIEDVFMTLFTKCPIFATRDAGLASLIGQSFEIGRRFTSSAFNLPQMS